MNAVVEILGISKTFGEVRAVSDLTLSIFPGEMFGLVGPDGAGKTTTIRMLCGVLTPTSGTATILGIDILKEPDLAKKEIGYLSQKFSLYGDLTIDENIEFFADINKVYDFKKRRQEVHCMLLPKPFPAPLSRQLDARVKLK